MWWLFNFGYGPPPCNSGKWRLKGIPDPKHVIIQGGGPYQSFKYVSSFNQFSPRKKMGGRNGFPFWGTYFSTWRAWNLQPFNSYYFQDHDLTQLALEQRVYIPTKFHGGKGRRSPFPIGSNRNFSGANCCQTWGGGGYIFNGELAGDACTSTW